MKPVDHCKEWIVGIFFGGRGVGIQWLVFVHKKFRECGTENGLRIKTKPGNPRFW